jgi:hypothetical protein
VLTVGILVPAFGRLHGAHGIRISRRWHAAEERLQAANSPIAGGVVVVFHGSMGGTPLGQPIVGIAATWDNEGYYLVTADGRVFTFGDATFEGVTGNPTMSAPNYGSPEGVSLAAVVGISSPASGGGYRFVAADGGVFCYGEPFLGSMGGTPSTPR